MFDLQSKKLIFNFEGNTNSVTSIAISPDGTFLASGLKNGNITLWQISDGSKVKTLDGHKSAVTRLFFSPDNELLYSSSIYSQVRIYQMSTKSFLREIKGYRGSPVYGFRYMSLSSDGTKLATVGFEKTGSGFGVRWVIRVVIWKAPTGEVLQETEFYGTGWDDYAFSPNGEYFSLFWYQKKEPQIALWSLSSENQQSTPTITLLPPTATQATQKFLFFSPDSKSIGFAGDGMITTWDINTKQLVNSTDIQADYYIRDAALSPISGDLALIDSTLHSYKIVNIDGTFSYFPAEDPLSIAYAPDGRITFGFSDYIRNNIAGNGRIHFGGSASQLAISVDGKYFAARHNLVKGVNIFDASGKKLKYVFPNWNNQLQQNEGSNYVTLSFSSDEKYLLAGTDKLNLVSTADWSIIRRKADTTAAEFSPDGSLIAYALLNKTIQIAKVPDFEDILTIPAQNEEITSLIFSPDGKMLISGAKDGVIKFWDIASGELLREIKAHTDQIKKLMFTSDSRILFSVSDDAFIRLWGIMP
jgi:WD40 repeat protein